MGEALLMNRSQEWNPEYTYTGDCTFTDEGNGNWNIKFTSGGTLTFIQPNSARRGIDVFLVGGGGGAAITTKWVYQSDSQYGVRSGGGGGYTKTVLGVNITRRTAYTITIGAGGAVNASTISNGYQGGRGGTTSASFSSACTAAGGYGGKGTMDRDENITYTPGNGGSGGSGGLGYRSGTVAEDYPAGGKNGGNGKKLGNVTGGIGQGTTTTAFASGSGTQYSAGGGKGTTASSNTGNGGFSNCDHPQIASHPEANGASGLIIIRNHRE